MPMTNPIFGVFARSPLRPLQEHMKKVTDCAQELIPFFSAVIDEQWRDVEKYQEIIVEKENEADTLKKELRLHLPKSVFLPVHRTDLLEVLLLQDKIANKAKDIAGLVLGRHLILPNAMAAPYQTFLARTIDVVNETNTAIHELDELLETGFRGAEAERVEMMIVDIDTIEHETDEMQIKIRSMLFDVETDLPPVEVMFLYKIIELTGQLANHAQTVAGQLQLLLAR